jgi:hypothetical protein
MPTREPTFKSELTGEVSDFISKRRRKSTKQRSDTEGDVEFLNILEFIDRFKLFPDGLFPAQKFVIKLYYNIPLDDKEKSIKITDRVGGRVLHELTEVEYLEYLFDNKRCNIRKQDLTRERRELILILGRRSGKSALSAVFAAYELYKLLKRGHPQAYYGMPSGSEIRILDIANDKEQASIVYNDIQGHIQAIDYFKSSVAHDTQTFLRFRTEHDAKKFGPQGKGTITATFKSSIAKGLRGRGIICAILDEIAFFVDNGKSSAERVYKAIKPSIAQFARKDKKTRKAIGDTEGRIILISSPDAREGFFYKQYQMSMSGGPEARNMLMIQAPTWEIRPDLPQSYYEEEYAKDPAGFMTEHGAEFSDRVRGFIEDPQDLYACVVPDMRPRQAGIPRDPHFAGVDFGLSGDGTAIALSRIHQGRIELAYHEVWYPKIKWADANPHLLAPLVPYAMTLQDVSRIDIDAIADWFFALSRRFYILRGVFDQWAGPVFESILHKRTLNQFEMKNFTTSDSSAMWQQFKMAMYYKQIALYDYPVPEPAGDGKSWDGTRHSPLITELTELQATSGGKNIIIVEAPKVRGKHDDMSDALARSVYLAQEFAKDNPAIMTHGLDVIPLNMNRVPTYGYHHYHRMRNRMHGGGPSMRRPSRVRSR